MESNKITINGINVPKDTEVKASIEDECVVITFSPKESKEKEYAIKKGNQVNKGDVLKISYYGEPYTVIANRVTDDFIYFYACLGMNDNKLSVSNDYEKFLIKKHVEILGTASIADFRRLQNELAGQKKLHWNTETLKLEKYRFRAEKGGKYFYISDDGYILEDTDNYTGKHHSRYHFGNYFETEKLCTNAKIEVRSKLISL